jgi:hypothetical protein
MNQTKDLLFSQIERAFLPLPERDFCFYPPCNWSATLAWSKPKLLVEIDPEETACGCGPIHSEREKLAMAAVLGYRVMRFSPSQIRNEFALSMIQAILREDG